MTELAFTHYIAAPGGWEGNVVGTSTYRNTVQQQEVVGNCSREPGSQEIIMERYAFLLSSRSFQSASSPVNIPDAGQDQKERQLKPISKNSSIIEYGRIHSSGSRLSLPRMMVWCVWKLAGSRLAGWLDAGASGALRCAN